MELEFVNLTSSITPSPIGSESLEFPRIQGRNVSYNFEERTKFLKGEEPFWRNSRVHQPFIDTYTV